jgi:hypothetical protein
MGAILERSVCEQLACGIIREGIGQSRQINSEDGRTKVAQTGAQIETVRGRVEQANEKGLKVDGRWFNWSQYSRATVRPQEGADVELEIARGKFINDARILGDGTGTAGVGGDRSLDGFDDEPFGFGPPTPAAVPSAPRAAAAATRQGQSATPNADRNTEIRRLALIKAAADYAAARELEPDDVVALAARWEEWVIGASGAARSG